MHNNSSIANPNMENVTIKEEIVENFIENNIERDSSSIESSLSGVTLIEDIGNNSNSCSIDLQRIKSENDDSLDYCSTINDFCFDSDHPALKANDDYKNLIQAISILEAQRNKAIKDLDRLYELQHEALLDPIAFVEQVHKRKDLNIPGPQVVYPVPVIDWSKYTLSSNSSTIGRRQLTRLSAKVSQDFTKSMLKLKSNGSIDQKPPQKTSQYWSAEEQKKLEELLIQFPPEEIEVRRWEKIANCLENRTPIQVASRVQKYFIKLMKAGIPIPGRTPSTVYLKKARRNVIRQQPSTFLVSHSLPVYMPEVEEDYSHKYYPPQNLYENNQVTKIELSEDEVEISPQLQGSSDFQELKLLKNILRDKLKNCGLAEHTGYKCICCKTEPIIGVRWHCTVCKQPSSIDFCDDCAESKFEVGNHLSTHRLEEIPNASSEFLESDYSNFIGGDYNYLDPTYMPAM